MPKTRAELLDLFARQVADWLRRYPAEVGTIRERVCAALKFAPQEFRSWIESGRDKDAVAALDAAIESAPSGAAESGNGPAAIEEDAAPEFIAQTAGPLEFDAESDDGKQADWLDKEFPVLLSKVAQQIGSKRAIAIAWLMRQIARNLAGRDAATEAVVRETLCESIKEIKKADYEKCLREAKATLKKSADSRAQAAAAEGDVGDWVGWARKFLRDLGENRALLYWREKWYEWTRASGAYREQEKEWILDELIKWLSSLGQQHDDKTVANLRSSLRAICRIDWEIHPPHWLGDAELARDRNKSVFISLQNGILDLESVKFVSDASELDGSRIEHAPLIDHTPEFFTVNSLPYQFDATARCPQLDEAIAKWQPVWEKDPEGQGAGVLQDFAGYILEPGQPRQVMLLNWGSGRDGKSQFSEICVAIAGAHNTTSLGLEALDPSQTNAREPLIGKTLWIVPDANQIEKMGEGTLKAITGGDEITIHRKWVSAWRGKIEAKVLMNCNEFPGFRDRSEGIWRRIMLLHWQPLPREAIVDKFAERLIQTEMPGIFNWALRGWRRVRDCGFSFKGAIAENVSRVRRESQAEFAFFDQCVDIVDETKDHRVSVEQLMEAYTNWCKSNNQPAFMRRETMGRALTKWVRWQLTAQGWKDEKITEFVRESNFHPLRTEPGKPRRRWYVRIRLLEDEPQLSETLPLGRAHSAPPSLTFHA